LQALLAKLQNLYKSEQICTVLPILESRLEKGLSVYELQDKVLVFGRMLPLCLAPKRFEAITDAQAMKLFFVQNDIPESEIYNTISICFSRLYSR